MEKLNFFSHKQYATKFYVVTENYAPNKSRTIGVFYSRERMMTIDAGTGACGDIRKYIEDFLTQETFVGTQFGTMCVCTSGVPENVGGAGYFDEAYIDGADLAMAQANLSDAHKASVIAKHSGNNPDLAAYCPAFYVDDSKVQFMDYMSPELLRTPDSFDHFHLGGVHLEGLKMPGVTPGSLAILVFGLDLPRYAFTGESLNFGCTNLARMDRKTLETYRASLQNLFDHTTADTAFFGSDSPEPFGQDVLEDVMRAVDDILAGNTYGDIPTQMVFHGEVSPDDIRLHYVNGRGVAYNRTRLAQ